MRFYTSERLSAKRAKTPEGYLLCEDVPLARTGTMFYAVTELPGFQPAPGDERIAIRRTPDEVFAPATLASYAGKPLCDDHPAEDVTPATWAKLSKGIILNPRQGSGAQSDLVIGDILITDPGTIKEVEANEKTELSAGYDANYTQTAPGEGYQHNIIVNHVALVKDGRCGPRCHIGDSNNPPLNRKGITMKLTDALMRAFKAKDAAEVEGIAKELDPQISGGGEGGEHHVHVHLPSAGKEPALKVPPIEDAVPSPAGEGDMNTRLTALETMLKAILAKLTGGASPGAEGPGVGAEPNEDAAMRDKRAKDEAARKKEIEDRAHDDATIEGALEMEAPPGTEDRARKSKDSSYLSDAYRLLASQIEIIAPGQRMATFDSAARPAVTYTQICGMRTETLDHVYSRRPDLQDYMNRLNGGRRPDFRKMTCDSARTMIAAVAAEIGRQNNGTTTRDFGMFAASQGSGPGAGALGTIKTPAQLNELAKQLYKTNA